MWGIRKYEKAYEVTLVYDFKDDGRVDLTASSTSGEWRITATAKGKWTYDKGILKIRLGPAEWDNSNTWGWSLVPVLHGILRSELELQGDFRGNRNDRAVAWHGEDTISMRWTDGHNYRRWWENFMRDWLWHSTKSVTVAQIGDDGCWHMHSYLGDTCQPGMRLVSAVGDRLAFRRVSPRMVEVKHQNKKEVLPRDVSAPPNRPPYRVIDLVREKGSDFAYTFSLELVGEASIQTFFGVQNMFASEVRAAYLMEYPSADVSALRVVVLPRLSNGRIVGRAEVLTITPVSLTYDPNTRKGVLAARYNANQFVEAREWIRKNIETLARDKNIALVTGEIPPVAKFYLGREELKDGNVLEIEFKTE